MLNRVSIRRREVTTLIVLIIGFIVVSVLVYDSLRSIDASTRRVTELTECQVRVGQIQASLDTLLVQLQQVAVQPDSDTNAGLTANQIAVHFDELPPLDYPEMGEARALFSRLRVDIKRMMRQEDEAATLASESISDVRSLNTALLTIESRVHEEIVAEVSVTRDRVTVAIARALLSLLALALVSTLILITNAYSITSGINVLTAGARSLASPDTSGPPISFPAGRSDEFTRLGEDFNQMAAAIRAHRIAIHKHMKELEEARAAAEAATERKSDYLANMSHELRAPLHIIMNFTKQVMGGEAGRVTKAQKKLLQSAMDSSQHLLRVINDVLDKARIEAGQLEIEAKDLPLDDLLGEMTLSAHALIEQRGKDISFSIERPPELPNVYADENRVRQILLNLIGNAVRFTDEGGIKMTFGVGVDALTICIEDSGVGIPPEKLADIFERFEQAGELEEERRGGTGLGLSIARDLTHLQDGRIWATSVVGEGSNFCFTLPIATAFREPR